MVASALCPTLNFKTHKEKMLYYRLAFNKITFPGALFLPDGTEVISKMDGSGLNFLTLANKFSIEITPLEKSLSLVFLVPTAFLNTSKGLYGKKIRLISISEI